MVFVGNERLLPRSRRGTPASLETRMLACSSYCDPGDTSLVQKHGGRQASQFNQAHSAPKYTAPKHSARKGRGADLSASRSCVPAIQKFYVDGHRIEYQSSQSPVAHHAALEITRRHGYAVLGPIVPHGNLAILFYAYYTYKCHAQVFANGIEVPAQVEYCGDADPGVMAWRIFLPRLCRMPSLSISYRIIFFADGQTSCSEWYNAILRSKSPIIIGRVTEKMDPEIVKQLQRDLRNVMPSNSKTMPSTLNSISEVDDPTTEAHGDTSADETVAKSEPKSGIDERGHYTISAAGHRLYHPKPIRGVPFILDC